MTDFNSSEIVSDKTRRHVLLTKEEFYHAAKDGYVKIKFLMSLN